MALLFIIGGGLAALVVISGYAFRILREVETLLPDHDTLPSAATAGEPAPDERLTRMQELLEARNHWVTQPVYSRA